MIHRKMQMPSKIILFFSILSVKILILCRKENENKEIILRSYQVALIEKCCKENSIIFLPTGSGKTCIAMYALTNFGHTFGG